VSVEIRAGSRFKRFLYFILTGIRYVRVPQVGDHWRVPSVQNVLATEVYR
jgi:hypothetical protein